MSLRTSRRADEFARLLDGSARSDDPALAHLLGLAEALRAVPVGPSPEFRTALRQRVVAVAAVQAAPAAPVAAPGFGERATRWLLGWRGQRRMAWAVGTLAVAVLVGAIGIGASRSLPGDLFYGVKRDAEAVQLWTTRGNYDRGTLHLEFARTRLREVRALTGQAMAMAAPDGTPSAAALAFGGSLTERVNDTLADMDTEIRAGSRDLTLAYRASGRRDALQTLARFARGQRADLTALLPALPAGAQDGGQQSVALLTRLDGTVTALLAATACPPNCGGSSTPTPGATLAPSVSSSGSAPSGSPAPGTVGGSGPATVPGGTGTGTGTGSGSGTGTGNGQPADGGVGGLIQELTGGLTGPTPGKTSRPTTGPVLPTSPPPSLPGLPSLPTSLPTSLPSLLPSALPSLLPTSLPSLLPTSLPSLLPSLSLTTLPSLPPLLPSTGPLPTLGLLGH